MLSLIQLSDIFIVVRLIGRIGAPANKELKKIDNENTRCGTCMLQSWSYRILIPAMFFFKNIAYFIVDEIHNQAFKADPY